MANACPIAYFNVDEKVVRTSAFITLVMALVFIFTSWKWVIFVLTLDFLLRGFFKGKASPIAASSRLIAKALKITPQPINAGPKLFAAKIGFICCILISIFYLLNLMIPSYIVSWILIICALLESFFGYCVGCKVYYLVNRGG